MNVVGRPPSRALSCGTVARTGEIGRAPVAGVEKKGKINRRVRIALADSGP
jgi:Ser-tRNA(Ala) deacylase AlaX